MRSAELSKNLAETQTDSSTLQIITDFGTKISGSNLNLEDTLHAILLNVSHLVPADFLEVKIWDTARKSLTTYILDASGASGVQRARSQFEGLTDSLIAQLKPLLVPDIHSPNPTNLNLKVNSAVESYLGTPLLADQQLMGTLEFGHLSPGALGQHDLDLIKLISAQAAYGIRNALLFASEQGRSAELAGLANLAQAFSNSQEYTDLIARLVETIKSLFAVDILGFLLYDEGRSALEAQSPFQGLPSHIVDIYRTTINSNSTAEKIILSRKTIITRNAADDQ